MMYDRRYRSQDAPTPGKRRVGQLSGAIDSALKSLGVASTYYGWQIVSNWPEIVGEQVARVATAVRFQDGVLYAAVVDDAWRQELTMQIETIMEKIHRYPHGKTVRTVRFVRGEKG